MLLSLLLLYLSLKDHLGRADFDDYKAQISWTITSQDTIQFRDQILINLVLEVKNATEEKWENITFEVKYLSPSDELLNVERDSDYLFVLGPNSTVPVAVKVPLFDTYQGARLVLEITDLRPYR